MFYRTDLPNGLKLVGESMPDYRTFAAGLWVGAGSVWEGPENSGISHFLEHMAFKGTSRYTTRSMAEAMDRVGGLVNAFTDRECTCYYGKALYEDAEKLTDILSDMAVSPSYLPDETEKERGVILEEIDMAEDSPEDVVQDLLMEAMYGGDPLSRPILGTKKNVRSFTRSDIDAYRARRYRPEESVFSVAGRFDWDEVVRLAERHFGNWEGGGAPAAAPARSTARPRSLTRTKSIEQSHVCLGWEGLGIRHPDTYALSVLCGIFGGASSSRLFQKVREECGLAYSVYSDAAFFDGTGVLSVYAAVSPENLSRVTDILYAEAEKLADGGVTGAEFDSAMVQIRNGLLIGGESTNARMQANGRRLLLEDGVMSEEEILDRIASVTIDRVNALARDLLRAPCASATVRAAARRTAGEREAGI